MDGIGDQEDEREVGVGLKFSPPPESMHSHAFAILADRRYEPRYTDFFSEAGSRTWEKGEEDLSIGWPKSTDPIHSRGGGGGGATWCSCHWSGVIPKRGAHDEGDMDRLRRSRGRGDY